MAVVWSRYCPLERSHGGKHQDTFTYEEFWLIRTDSPSEPMTNIRASAGYEYMDPHPDDSSCKAIEFDVRPEGDSGLLYKMRIRFAAPPPNTQGGDGGGGDGGGGGQPGQIPGIMKTPVWGASSSVTSGPCFEHFPDDGDNVTKETITNSAGDPLEGLEKEQAGFRLTLTQYYASHNGWRDLSRDYTNAINSAGWNGGGAREWKCQGCSARLQTENNGGATIVYWEVGWEFEYKPGGWDLMPWDVGFAQLVDDEGEPAPYGTKRAQIKGQDGKGVRQPVALNADGTAKEPGQKPNVINGSAGVRVYQELPFDGPFGQLFTP
jgi:hypothetical protein